MAAAFPGDSRVLWKSKWLVHSIREIYLKVEKYFKESNKVVLKQKQLGIHTGSLFMEWPQS